MRPVNIWKKTPKKSGRIRTFWVRRKKDSDVVVIRDQAAEIMLNAANYGFQYPAHVHRSVKKSLEYVALFGRKEKEEGGRTHYIIESACPVESFIPGGTAMLERSETGKFLGWAKTTAFPKSRLLCLENGFYQNDLIRLHMNEIGASAYKELLPLDLCFCVSRINYLRVKQCQKSDRPQKRRPNSFVRRRMIMKKLKPYFGGKIPEDYMEFLKEYPNGFTCGNISFFSPEKLFWYNQESVKKKNNIPEDMAVVIGKTKKCGSACESWFGYTSGHELTEYVFINGKICGSCRIFYPNMKELQDAELYEPTAAEIDRLEKMLKEEQ